MRKVNSGNFNLVMSIAEIVLGFLLLIDPVGFTSGVIVALGIVLTVMGIGQMFGYFRTDAVEAAKGGKLTKGVLLVIFGLFCAFKSGWIIATFPVITVLYGVLILVAGVSKLQKGVDMARVKQQYWFVALISAILTLLFAVLIIFDPFTSTAALWTFIGVSLIVEAIMDIVTFVFAKRT